MRRSIQTALLLAASAVASLAWLGWQGATVLAAAGGPPSHAEAELRILSGLIILGGWVVAWRRYRSSEERSRVGRARRPSPRLGGREP